MSNLDDYLQSNNWHITSIQKIEPREGQYYGYDDINLSRHAQALLHKELQKGLYRHQKEAIISLLNGDNVCLSTGTASGKSLVFYVAGVESLVKQQNSKIIAIYPLRALGKEQEERWIIALHNAKINVQVGRIDDEDSLDNDYLQKLDILPYRAGYEVEDRNIIQENLAMAS
jgi:DEAD/DEAH box helicase domain-containing protein